MSDNKSLPLRRLGLTDMKITPVGFGAWALGGGEWAFGWGSQDDADSIAAIRHAVEHHGVNWIDRGGLWSRPVRGGRWRGLARDVARPASLRLHQMRVGLGRGRSPRRRQADRPA